MSRAPKPLSGKCLVLAARNSDGRNGDIRRKPRLASDLGPRAETSKPDGHRHSRHRRSASSSSTSRISLKIISLRASLSRGRLDASWHGPCRRGSGRPVGDARGWNSAPAINGVKRFMPEASRIKSRSLSHSRLNTVAGRNTAQQPRRRGDGLYVPHDEINRCGLMVPLVRHPNQR